MWSSVSRFGDLSRGVEMLEQVHENAHRAGATRLWGQAESGLCSLEKILGRPHLKGFWKRGRLTLYTGK